MTDKKRSRAALERELEALRQEVSAWRSFASRYDSFLMGVSQASRVLLTVPDLRRALDQAVEILGKAAEIDRVCIFEVGRDAATSARLATLLCGWTRQEVNAPNDKSTRHDMPFPDSCARWLNLLAAGEGVVGLSQDFPDCERYALEAQGIRSLLAVPIPVDGFWGFIVFGDCHSEREWPNYEQHVLAAMAAAIGGAMARERSDAALRENRDLLRALMDTSLDFVYFKDCEGRYTHLNRALANFLGGSPEDLIGKTDLDMYSDADIVTSVERERGLLSQAVPLLDHEVRRTCPKDGTSRWLWSQKVAVHDDEGGVVGLLGITRDITERKRVEEALREGEERFRAIYQNSPAGIAVTTLGQPLRFINANPAFCALLGYSEEDLTHMTVEAITDPGDFRKEQELGARIMRREIPFFSVEKRYIRKDGQTVWVELTTTVVWASDGTPLYAVGVVLDISARRSAEIMLREREEQYRLITEAMTDAVWMLDMDFRMTFTNPAAERALGFSLEEHQTMTLDQQMTPESHARALAAIERELMPERLSDPTFHLSHTLELDLCCKEGGTFLAELTVTLMRDASGHPSGFLAVGRDVTQRKRAVEGLVAASRMEATATLAGGVAHDFNNLMVAVLGNADLLRRNLQESPAVNEMLGDIVECAQRAGELAQLMLAYARGGKYNPRVLDVNTVVGEAAQVQLRRALMCNVRIVTQLGAGLKPIVADLAQMNIVVANLVQNAIEAMPHGGEIRVATSSVVPLEPLNGDDTGVGVEHILITVRDTGCGMDDAVRRRIFEPFYTTKFQGRGLGLAAIYGIIKNHNGHIRVKSAPGQGSTFSVYLPACDLIAEHEPHVLHEIPRGTETVLVVDDEEMVVFATRRILEHLGYSVLVARDGHEAVRTAREYQGTIHATLLDLAMPEMNGYDAFPLLKACRPKMQVLVCSGFDLDPSAQALLDAGAAAFVRKPFSVGTIGTEIRRALERD